MTNKRVQRVQELRRSNAATAIPGKRTYDLPWQQDWEDDFGVED
jgi:hypothetical protein